MITIDHVPLTRKFKTLTTEELSASELTDSEYLALLGGAGWDTLLDAKRVVVHASAGSGKTEEMKARAEKLNDGGGIAFFMPLERLADEGFESYLNNSPGYGELLARWRDGGGEDAWFFLDSVDELKLTGQTLETALRKFRAGVGAALSRARVILSSRPLDWDPTQDAAILNAYLPVPQQKRKVQQDGESAFLEVLQGEDGVDESADEALPKSDVLHVALLPLDESQIRTFAGAKETNDPDAFIDEIRKRDAWSLARRPLDLIGLIRYWNRHRAVGTKYDQHQAAVRHMLEEDGKRPDSGLLSPERAEEGSARLALALHLKKCRMIALPAFGAAKSDLLDARQVLSDWRPEEVESLLRRPLFDFAGSARLRFQNREIEAYLSAERLKTLTEAGLSTRRLGALFFEDRYGERVVVPSMRSVAAWVAHWNSFVCDELLAREPEILVGEGDPEGLQLETKRAIIKAYFDKYRAGSWRGLSLSRTEIQRLADPALEPLILELWGKGPTNHEVRQLLMELVWLGKMPGGGGIAASAAMDKDEDSLTRILATKALAEIGATSALRSVAEDMMARESRWPDRVITQVFADLFPAFLSVDDLMSLVGRVQEPKHSINGFAWPLYEFAKQFDLGQSARLNLEGALAKALFEHRDPDAGWYDPKSERTQLAPALTVLLLRRLETGGALTQALADQAVMAMRFKHVSLGEEDGNALRQRMRSGADGRKVALLAELRAVPEEDRGKTARNHCFAALHHGLCDHPREDDWDWLLPAYREEADAAIRAALFEIALDLFRDRGRSDADLAALRAAAEGFPIQKKRLKEALKPVKPDPKFAAMEAEHEARVAEREKERAEKHQQWLDWREKLIDDPDTGFDEERLKETLRTLIIWLRNAERGNTIGYANWRSVRQGFGDAVADRFETALRAAWRNSVPEQWSRRTPENENAITEARQFAQTGLLIEAASGPDWAARLCDDEARRAAEWALAELNGFPEWFGALQEHHPMIVSDVITTELQAEFAARMRLGHAHTLSALKYGQDGGAFLDSDVLHEALRAWPSDEETANKDTAVRQLKDALSLLLKGSDHSRALALEFEARFDAEAAYASGTRWLRALCTVDLKRGVNAIKRQLEAIRGQSSDLPLAWMSSLFGDPWGEGGAIPLEADTELLVDLACLSHDIVRREDDRDHEGPYTPDTRDNAESARNGILNKIINMPGRASYAALIGLADNPLFAHMPDRLRHLARERAASDSESASIPEDQIVEFENRYGAAPQNNDQLFHALMDRLEQINHDLLHDDFTDRDRWAEITDEGEMQPLLARRLHLLAHDHYQVEREPEVADKKKPDVRLIARSFEGIAAVELKIADGASEWSVRQLEDALEKQLIGQYLRHERCRVGALVITFAGRKKSGFNNPDGGRRLKFDHVIERLNAKAAVLQAEHDADIRVAVVGIDLRPPLDGED